MGYSWQLDLLTAMFHKTNLASQNFTVVCPGPISLTFCHSVFTVCLKLILNLLFEVCYLYQTRSEGR